MIVMTLDSIALAAAAILLCFALRRAAQACS
jgi:hypothetical protein